MASQRCIQSASSCVVILSLCASTPTAISLIILPTMVATFGIGVGIAFIVGNIMAIVLSWSLITDFTTKVTLVSLTKFLEIRFNSPILKTVGIITSLTITALYVALSTVVCGKFFEHYDILVIIAVGIVAVIQTLTKSETISSVFEGLIATISMILFVVNIVIKKENMVSVHLPMIDYLNTTDILPESTSVVFNSHIIWLALIGGMAHGATFIALNETSFYRFKLLLTPQHCRLAIIAVTLTHFFIGVIATCVGHVFALNGISVYQLDVSVLKLSPVSSSLLAVSLVAMMLAQITNIISVTVAIVEAHLNKEITTVLTSSDRINVANKENPMCLHAFAGGVGLTLTLLTVGILKCGIHKGLITFALSIGTLCSVLIVIGFCVPVIDQKGAIAGFLASIVAAGFWIFASNSETGTENLAVFWETDFVVGNVIGIIVLLLVALIITAVPSDAFIGIQEQLKCGLQCLPSSSKHKVYTIFNGQKKSTVPITDL